MKRRYALITAAFMLIFSLTALAQGFSDMPSKDSPYYEAMDYAVKNNIISGYDGKINPDALITKAEAVTVLSRVVSFGTESADLSKVTDVSPADWYYPVMAKAVQAGVISINPDNTLKPFDTVLEKDAAAMVAKAFKTTLSPTAENAANTTNANIAVTRAAFIQMVYSCLNYTSSAQHNTEDPTQAPTEAATESNEFSQIRAEQAKEAMQVALGILPDGTSYVNVAAYTDKSYTDWASDKVSGSSRPETTSRPSKPSGGEDEPEKPTEAPTEAPTQAPSDEPTEAPNNPTDPPSQEPSYSSYDGPIDNDKDNVIEDPFDDGWRPPGWIDDDDEGQGGYDEEEDFIINDDDDPDYVEKTEPSTEDITEAPSQEETEIPTQDVTEIETDDPTEAETESPSDEATETGTESPSDNATEDSSDSSSASEESLNPISQVLSFFSKVWWFS